MSTEPEPFEPPPISIRRRLLLLSGSLIAVLALVGIARWSHERSRSLSRLDAIIADLDAYESPWRLEEIEDARPLVPDASNSARIVALLDTHLPRGWPDTMFDDRLGKPPPPELLDPERRRLLADEMTTVAPALAEARKLALMPRGRHHLVYPANPIQAVLKDQQETRRAVHLLHFDAWDRALAGDLKGALETGRAGINACRSLGDEPFAISQLIRVSCLAAVLAGIERSLALGEATDADLAEMQKLLVPEEKHRTLLVVIRGERALMHAIFDRLDSGIIPMEELLDTSWGSNDPDVTWHDRLFGISRNELRQQQCMALELMTRLVEAAALPEHEQVAAEGRVVSEMEARIRDSRSRLAAMLLPPLMPVSKSFRRKTAQVRCMLALVAVERYRLKHGRWPDKLDDLTPDLLATVPPDPGDGKPLRYRRVTDGVIVYAVGDDGMDNGGDIFRHGPPPGKDVGYQLWDVPLRRQPAKPPPKPPEDEGGPRSDNRRGSDAVGNGLCAVPTYTSRVSMFIPGRANPERHGGRSLQRPTPSRTPC